MTADQFVQTTLGGLAIGCIYSLIALGISMIIRATDILHFAQGEMLMIGSMMGLSAYWLHGMPFVLVLLAGTVGGGLVSMAIEFFIYRRLRLRRVSLINIMIATLGVSIVLQNVARMVWGSEPLRYPSLFASNGLVFAGFVVSPQLVWIVVLSGAGSGRRPADGR
jgi:branched-subunit amino acid ABC-type transport system permease component